MLGGIFPSAEPFAAPGLVSADWNRPLDLASPGMLTSGDKSNRQYVGADVESGEVDENLLRLFFDPQTAGGMLISIPESASEALLGRLRENYGNARIIGRVHPRGPHSIIISTD